MNDRKQNRYPKKGPSKPPVQNQRRGSVTAVVAGHLPRWVRDEITRSTPKDRRDPALTELAKAIDEFADERYQAALPHLRRAKTLAPRAATIREMLGLSAYRSGGWEEGLRELRTFRRLTGDSIHMPVEMDCLRAMGKAADVTKTWERFRQLDTSATVNNEARVVYASFLLDQNRAQEAWEVVKPGRLIASPSPGELRRWFVAAKVALAAGDKEAARKLYKALESHETDFGGIEELGAQLS